MKINNLYLHFLNQFLQLCLLSGPIKMALHHPSSRLDGRKLSLKVVTQSLEDEGKKFCLFLISDEQVFCHVPLLNEVLKNVKE